MQRGERAPADYMKKLCLVVCLFLALCDVSCKKSVSPPAVDKDKAPDFTLSDLQKNKITLSALRGKVVLVEFWATWCPPCRDMIPELNAVYTKYKDRGVVILGVSMDRGGDIPSSVRSFAKEHAIAYPVLLDDSDAASLYEVAGIPALFIVDKSGKVAGKHTGFVPGLAETLSQEIEALL
jgi:peroxiredoxin